MKVLDILLSEENCSKTLQGDPDGETAYAALDDRFANSALNVRGAQNLKNSMIKKLVGRIF